METLSSAQLEAAARLYCEKQGLEPNEQVTARNELTPRPRWHVVATQIRTQDAINCIIDEVRG